MLATPANTAHAITEVHLVTAVQAIKAFGCRAILGMGVVLCCVCYSLLFCIADGHSEFLAACKRRAEGKLSLEHSDTDVCNTSMCDAEGPYDVVILDMALSQLVLALMQVSSSSLSP